MKSRDVHDTVIVANIKLNPSSKAKFAESLNRNMTSNEMKNTLDPKR